MQKDIHRINEILSILLKTNKDPLLKELSLLIKKNLRNKKEFEEFNNRLRLFMEQD